MPQRATPSARTGAPPTLLELAALAVVACAGGVAGSAARLIAAETCTQLQQPAWLAPSAVNMVGALLAGLIVGRLVLPESSDPLSTVDAPLRLREHLLVTGFLGGFTTVSGFAGQAVALLSSPPDAPDQQGLFWLFALNGAVGIGAAVIGVVCGRRMRRGRTPLSS